MKPIIYALILLSSACALTRAPSENLLEKRADYEGVHEIESSLQAVDNPLLVPIRTQPVVADIWVHPHELANGDYFRGGWVRTVVTRSQWQMEETNETLLIKTPEKPATMNPLDGRK